MLPRFRKLLNYIWMDVIKARSMTAAAEEGSREERYKKAPKHYSSLCLLRISRQIPLLFPPRLSLSLPLFIVPASVFRVLFLFRFVFLSLPPFFYSLPVRIVSRRNKWCPHYKVLLLFLPKCTSHNYGLILYPGKLLKEYSISKS